MINILMWVVAGLVCLIIGREVGKILLNWGSTVKAKAQTVHGAVANKIQTVRSDIKETRKEIQELSITLREQFGFKLIPELLDDMVICDVFDVADKIHDFAKMMKSGNEAILKEVEASFERTLKAKLNTPEGRARVEASLELAKKVAIETAKVAVPIIIAAL